MKSTIVIDDFLPDPYAFRQLALSQTFPVKQNTSVYPGRDSELRQPIKGLDQLVSEVTGEPLVPVPGTSHAKFRLALEGDEGSHGVHIDNVHWTMILYLTLPEHCQDGTHFFRHKETNSDRAPINVSELNKLGYTDQSLFLEEVLYKNTKDKSKWEKIMTIPMRFNRCVLIRPQQYHDAGVSFGSNVENGRLIYLGAYNHASTIKMSSR